MEYLSGETVIVNEENIIHISRFKSQNKSYFHSHLTPKPKHYPNKKFVLIAKACTLENLAVFQTVIAFLKSCRRTKENTFFKPSL